MKKEGDIYIHIWFGPCPNSTVRATAPCAPESTPRGPAPDSTPRGRLPPLKRQRARRTTRLTARSRARLPALTVPCAPPSVRRPGRKCSAPGRPSGNVRSFALSVFARRRWPMWGDHGACPAGAPHRPVRRPVRSAGARWLVRPMPDHGGATRPTGAMLR